MRKKLDKKQKTPLNPPSYVVGKKYQLMVTLWWIRIEDVFPIEKGDISLCYVSLLEGKWCFGARWFGFGLDPLMKKVVA